MFKKVLKKGKIIGIIYGYLKVNIFLIKVNFLNLYCMFYNCFVVGSIFEDKLFFE